MIKIKNIYYMLSYAFNELNSPMYKNMEVEDFENIGELFSEIIYLGVSKLIKQGLIKEYKVFNEELSIIKGRINTIESINHQIHLKHKLICSNDKFTINNYMNQILKTTMIYILKTDMSSERRNKLKNILRYFVKVQILDYKTINWNINYTRYNQTYQMLINLSHMFFNDLLLTQESGKIKLRNFEDSMNMHKLYEKFILEFYRKEYSDLKVNSKQINWQIDESSYNTLPIMKTDVMIEYNHNILIIDAKYYDKILIKSYDNKKIRSNHLYQIFAYVKNKQYELDFKYSVSGLVLYAKTDEKEIPDDKYSIQGNMIGFQTLNLNQDFTIIKNQLHQIIIDYLY